MRDTHRVLALGNGELLAGLFELVRQSNELTADVLAHLAELETRMLHLELGFPSAFAYCVEVLGLSEGAAGRRLTGARVCRRFPEAFALIASGDLHLSALCGLAPHLNPENASDLFDACRRKSRRQVEALLAARFPRPDVREQIRRLPIRAAAAGAANESWASGSGVSQRDAGAQSPATGQREAVAQPSDHREAAVTQPSDQLSGAARAEMAGILECRWPAQFAQSTVPVPTVPSPPPAPSGPSRIGRAAPRRRELEALSGDRFGVHFTADVELRDLIDRARALASHRLPQGDLSSLMKLALATFVLQEERRRFALGSKPRRRAVGSKQGRAGAQSEAMGTRAAGVEASARRESETLCGNELALPAHALGPVREVGLNGPVREVGPKDPVRELGPKGPVREVGLAFIAVVPTRSGNASTPPGEVPSEHKLLRGPAAHPNGPNAAGLSRSRQRGRHVPAAVRRQVYLRDQGRCSFVAEDGRRCEARGFLELDHIRPWAAHGASEADNLRLRCRPHNGLHARNCFGSLHIAAKIAARRRAARPCEI